MSIQWHQALQNAHLIWPDLNIHILTCHHANSSPLDSDPLDLNPVDLNPCTPNTNPIDFNPCTSNPTDLNPINPQHPSRLEKLLVLETDTSNKIKTVLLQTPWLENGLPYLHSKLCELACAKVIGEGWVVRPIGSGVPSGVDPKEPISSAEQSLISGTEDPTRSKKSPSNPARSVKERCEGAAGTAATKNTEHNLINAETIRQDPAYFLHITEEIIAEEGLGDYEETAFHEDMDAELRAREVSAAEVSLLRNSKPDRKCGGKGKRKVNRKVERWNNNVDDDVDMVSSGVVQGVHRNDRSFSRGIQSRIERVGGKPNNLADSPLLRTSGSPLETYAGSGTSAAWSLPKPSPILDALQGLKLPFVSRQPFVSRRDAQGQATARNAQGPVEVGEQKWFGEQSGEEGEIEGRGLGIVVNRDGTVLRRTYDGGWGEGNMGFVARFGGDEDEVDGGWVGMGVSEGG